MDETSNSLLEKVRNADEAAWQRLIDCYTPFLQGMLLRRGLVAGDVDDVIQNVMAVVVRRIPDFQRQRAGSFRTWLRTICSHCFREHCRYNGKAGRATGGSRIAAFIDELADPASDLSRLWEQEHDQHVINHLLSLVQGEFRPNTFEAFRRLAIKNEAVDVVAQDLDISVNAAFVARSRVLKRLREIGAGMIE